MAAFGTDADAIVAYRWVIGNIGNAKSLAMRVATGKSITYSVEQVGAYCEFGVTH